MIRRLIYAVPAFLVLSALLGGQGLAAGYAVIVGVADYPGSDSDLNYTDDDARDFYNELLQDNNWNAANITLLIDSQATHGNIKDALLNMVTVSSSGDTCLFFFSGHGTNSADRAPYDESDGLDEYLCAYDLDIRDDELSQWLTNLPASVMCLFIESCFSGGQIKSMTGQALVKTRNLSGPPSAKRDGFVSDLFRRVRDFRDRDLDDLAVFASTASDDDESSWEMPFFGNGLYTEFLLQALNDAAADSTGNGQFSGEEVHAYLYPRVVEVESSQHPQFHDGNGALQSDFVAVAGSSANAPPSKPHSEAPADGLSGADTGLVLDWSCSDPDLDTVYYTVWLSRGDPSFSDSERIKIDSTGSSAYPGTLAAGEHYFWRVKADDHRGGVTYGDVWSFTTAASPTPGNVTLLQPADGSTHSLDRPPLRLDWNDVEHAASYTVYLERNDRTPDRMTASALTSSSWEISPGLSEPGTYYWKVTAENGGESSSSPVWSFAVEQPGYQVSATADPAEAEFGDPVQLSGRLNGAMSGGAPLWFEGEVTTDSQPFCRAWDCEVSAPSFPGRLSYTFQVVDSVSRAVLGEDKVSVSVAEPVDPERGPTVLHFPQFISGGGSGTEFILVNNCPETKTGSIVYYSNSDSSRQGAVIREEPYSIQPGCAASSGWYGSPGGPLRVGAVEITQEGDSSCAIEGTVFFDALGSHTTVSSSSLSSSQQIYALKDSFRDTGFAVHNPHTYPVEIEVFFNGREAGAEAVFTLGPKGHKAMFLSELFPSFDQVSGTLNFQSPEYQSFTLIGLLAVDRASNALVSLPAGPHALSRGGGGKALLGRDGQSRNSRTGKKSVGERGAVPSPVSPGRSRGWIQDFGDPVLYFPQFISGEGSGTEFILINNCSTAKQGSIVYYTGDGSAEAGQVFKSVPYSISSRDVWVSSWYGSEELKVGSVEVTEKSDTGCSIEGTEFFNALGVYTTVPDASRRSANQIFAFRNHDRDTGFAVYNPNDHPIQVEVIFKTDTGSINADFSLQSRGHQAMFLGELFPESEENSPGTLNFYTQSGDRFVLLGLFSVKNGAGLVSLPTSPNGLDSAP